MHALGAHATFPWRAGDRAPARRAHYSSNGAQAAGPEGGPQDRDPTYLDYNATTPVFPEVLLAMLPFLTTHWGNPSSSYARGREARAAIETAREQVASLIGARRAEEVVFTGCGTESNALAIQGTLAAWNARGTSGSPDTEPEWPHGMASYPRRRPMVLVGATEHPSVRGGLGCMAFSPSAQAGAQRKVMRCQRDGRTTPDMVATALRRNPEALLVSVMHANNETGCINNLLAISSIVQSYGCAMHTDAAQSIGKVPVNVRELGVDMLTLVGHKFGAPKGVAALYIRDEFPLMPLLNGGGQEGGRRSGTENVAFIVGLGAACALAEAQLRSNADHMRHLRARLRAALVSSFPAHDIVEHSPQDPAHCLPNTLSIAIRGLDAAALLQSLQHELAASAGSACHSSGELGISPVLSAMRVDREAARGTLRLSVGRLTTVEDVDRGAELILGEAARQGLKLQERSLPPTLRSWRLQV